jgi:hypothetical protein
MAEWLALDVSPAASPTVDFYSDAAIDVECSDIIPVRGQLGPLREFSRLRKLKTPIVTLLGWSPGELPLRIAEAVPAGLTHLGLTENMVQQYTYEWNVELVLKELAGCVHVCLEKCDP